MADHFFGILPGKAAQAVGQPDSAIVVGTSTAGATYIELRIPDALVTSLKMRETVELAIEAFEQFFAQHKLTLGG